MRLSIPFKLVLNLLLLAVSSPLFAQIPAIITGNVSGAAACAGSNLSVSFVTSIPGNAARSYTVQLSNATGLFITPTTLATGLASPIQVTLPAGALAGDYRLRVITDTTGVTFTPSSIFMMLRRPTAFLSGDTAISVGGTATLSIVFSGNGPWTYVFTNTNSGTTSTNPLKGIVQPTVSTTYALQSVSNICGTGTVSGSARVSILPRITTDLSITSICAGASLSVPFTVTGAFETAPVTYTAQLSNSVGNFTAPINIGTGISSPLSVKLPANITPSIGYRIRVIANSGATYVNSNAFSIKPLPTAFLSGAASIGPGDTTGINISFTGDAPWTYQISSGPVSTTTITPTRVTVNPTVTTNYNLVSVSNACGEGTVSGTATITVVPRISVADVALGTVCVGTNISLPFTVSGGFANAVVYTAQLSDATGSFAIPRVLNSGTTSPININIPANLPAGVGYRLRVVASGASTYINSPAFTIKARPTVAISGNSTVNFGETASLNLGFTGEGPWTFTLSDGSTNTADRTPFALIIKPSQTTTYVVSSVRNICGEGSTSGSASVTVIPRLVTENPTTAICSGKDVEVKFTVGGVLPANTNFQVQLSDSVGNFNNPTVIGTGLQSPITSTVPLSTPAGGNYRVRVVVQGGSTITLTPSNPFFLGRRPSAIISGGGNFPIKPGDEVFLVIQFSGDGPWSYTLSDNTTGTASASPAILTVKPQLPTTYTLKSVSNTCGEGIVSGSAIANILITSIDNPLQNGVSFFPNPVTKQLTVKITKVHATEWQLMDLQGRIVKSSRHDQRFINEETIDTQSLPTGTYFMKVKIEDRWFSTKIVRE